MGRYQKHVFICTNERPPGHPKGCCLHKNSESIKSKLKEELKKKGLLSIVRPNSSGCLDACEYGAVIVIYPEGVWYGNVKESDVPEIIEEHILGGRIVDRLKIPDAKYLSDTAVEPITFPQ